jgi:hypothetical protein
VTEKNNYENQPPVPASIQAAMSACSSKRRQRSEKKEREKERATFTFQDARGRKRTENGCLL